ncbi:DUF503 domain-containing protein [Ornithinibacillus bavariensis]|uniref:DUF503 domain-containing protein n=1 Tax=Ornithinibacillus bavariensis TaxID=545502 RepID=A0A919X5N9_9BACI|nr:DUF503 domain-containing protein [Ornithinibacillus bavariensis]GIO26194.1 hypothetical protein J43TS3_08050 [Ornithinibacillus bavariensis]HAM79434.1 DUF503 domain-containing protein [Ornithinibacillus sp.]
MIVLLEVECMLYDGHSLKEKRSVIKRLIARIQKDFNVSITELDFHDLWQRTKLGIVTITNEYSHGEKVMQEILRVIDTYSELDRTITNIEFL